MFDPLLSSWKSKLRNLWAIKEFWMKILLFCTKKTAAVVPHIKVQFIEVPVTQNKYYVQRIQLTN
jgi:hypothetical protein